MRSRWVGIMVFAVAGLVSLWAYPRLPDLVATHWNIRGEPDDYSSRLYAALFGPLIILGLRVVAEVLPRIDPRGRTYESFRETYWLLINVITLFAGLIHVAMLGSAIGWAINMSRVVPVGVGLLLVFMGNYLGRVEPNWFIGIRTPWTLSSDVVWRKVHRTAGWLFVGGGVLLVLAMFLPGVAIVPASIATIAVVVIVPVVQSYLLWRRGRAAGQGADRSVA